MAAKSSSQFYLSEDMDTNGKLLGKSPPRTTVVSNNNGTIAQTVSIDNINGSPLMTYAFRIGPGEELRKSLLHIAEKKNLQAAFVMTCVGSASNAKLRLANATAGDTNYVLDVVGPLEIMSLTGTLSGGAGHLHASVADQKGKVLGGHLLELIVGTTAEVVLGECMSLSFVRDHDERTGFSELLVFPR